MARTINTDRQVLIQKIPGIIDAMTTTIDIYASTNNSLFSSETRGFFQRQSSPKIKEVTAEIIRCESAYVDLLKAYVDFLTTSLNEPDKIISRQFSNKLFAHMTSLSFSATNLGKHFKTLCQSSEVIASGPSAHHHTHIQDLNKKYLQCAVMFSAELVRFALIISPHV